MKKIKWILLAAMLLALCLIQTAGADMTTRDLSVYHIVEAGRTLRPEYPDYAAQLEEGLTANQCTFSYSTSMEGVTVDKEGYITVEDDVEPGASGTVKVRVRKKNSSKTMTDELRILVALPPTRMEVSRSTLYMLPQEVKETHFKVYIYGSSTPYVIESATYDDDVIFVRSFGKVDENCVELWIRPKAPGETNVTLRTYNNIIRQFKAVVMDRMTKMTFASDHYITNVDEPVKLRVETDNGANGFYAYGSNFTITVYPEGAQYTMTDDFRFSSSVPGEYTVSFTVAEYDDWHNKTAEVRASTTVTVCDPANCVQIRMSKEELGVDQTAELKLYDAQGNPIWRPVTIEQSGKCVSLSRSTLRGLAPGEFTVHVNNADGSVTSQTFAVKATPAAIKLPVTELVLEIGESFDLAPTTDNGSYDFLYTVWPSSHAPLYDLDFIRMEGSNVVAQAPGSGVVEVRYTQYSMIMAQCRVTVNEGPKRVGLCFDKAPEKIGDTFRAYVADVEGTVYPAVFSIKSGDGVARVSGDGQGAVLTAGKFTIQAALDDGRVLSQQVVAHAAPSWLKHPNQVVTYGNTSYISMQDVESDAGVIPLGDVIVSVEDESVVFWTGYNLQVRGSGVTYVTLESVYSDAKTTFRVEVMPAETLYIGSATLNVPYGFASYLPVVTNGNGDEVELTWEITYEKPGEGNPQESGFVLEGGAIACIWPAASCVLTGTTAQGGTVSLNVYGYLLPETIRIDPEEIELEKGESAVLSVVTDEKGCMFEVSYWISETDGVVSHAEYSRDGSLEIRALKQGSTRIAAMLDNGAMAMAAVTVTDPYAYVRMPGDANDDGKVDAKDALLVMQYDAGWNVSINGYAGDVNADGKTDMADAMLLYKYASGLQVELKSYVPES